MAQPRNEYVQPVEGVAGGIPVPVAPAAGAAVELVDSSTTTEESIQQDGAIVPVLGEDAGALLIAGRDGANQFHLRMAQAAVAADETLRHTLVRAAVSGINTGAAAGAQLAAVEARSLSSLIAASNALTALVSGAVSYGTDTTGAAVLRAIEARTFGTSSYSESLNQLLVRAHLAAVDMSQPAGSQMLPLEAMSEANATDSVSSFRNRLFGDVTLRGHNGNGTQTDIIAYGDKTTNISGRTASLIQAIYMNAVSVGIDNTGAAVLRPVEARSDANFASAPTTLIGLHTLSTEYVFDVVNSVFNRIAGVPEVGASANLTSAILEARQNGYWSSLRQRRFAVKHNVEGANVTAQATYVATTPTLLLSNNAAAVRAILRSLYIAVDSATVNPVRVVIKIDSANRLSVAGTALTPNNQNSGGGASAITAFNENATATAEGAGTLRQFEFILPSGKAASISISFNDSTIIGLTGSWLVYIFDDAGLAAPSIIFNVDMEQAA